MSTLMDVLNSGVAMAATSLKVRNPHDQYRAGDVGSDKRAVPPNTVPGFTTPKCWPKHRSGAGEGRGDTFTSDRDYAFAGVERETTAVVVSRAARCRPVKPR